MTNHHNHVPSLHTCNDISTDNWHDMSFDDHFILSVQRSDRVRTAKIDLTHCQKYAPKLQQYFEVNCKLHRLGYCTRRDYLYRPKRELLKKFDGYSLRKKCRQRFNEQHQARQWFWMKKYKDEIMPARSLCCCIYATGGSMLKIRDVVEHVVSKRLSSGQVAI